MAQKNNIRSIRFTDELAELIDRQTGETFTQKFENLITRCVWELPKKEEEIKRLDTVIAKKRQEIAVLSSRSAKIINTVTDLERKLYALDTAIFDYSEDWGAKDS